MSTTETTEQTSLLCPSCGGGLEPTQTICVACRSALEEQVLAVRAADYPALFHNVVRNSAESHRGPVDPTSMDMLKAAESTSDDLDLVPLVPMDEPRKGGSTSAAGAGDDAIPLASATTSASLSAVATATIPLSSGSATSARETTVPLSASPAPAAAPVSRPSTTVYTPPTTPKLEPSSRYKHVIIAVVCLAAAAVLAAVLWSVLVPSRAADAPSDDSAAAQPAPTPAPAKSAAK